MSADAMKQAIEELATAIAWTAHGTVDSLGTDPPHPPPGECEFHDFDGGCI